MFLPNLSIKRPIFAAVMMLALVTLGIFSYRRLAIDMFPDVEIPVVSIVTKFPGASPETVEREVSKPDRGGGQPHLRRQARDVQFPGERFHRGHLFQLEVKLNDVAQEVRAKVGGIRGDPAPGDRRAHHSEAGLCGHADRLPGRPLGEALAPGPDHPGGEEDQAALGEHLRRGQEWIWWASPSGRSTSTSIRAPGSPGHGRGRSHRRPAVGEREHPAGPPDPGRTRKYPLRISRETRRGGQFRDHGHRPARAAARFRWPKCADVRTASRNSDPWPWSTAFRPSAWIFSSSPAPTPWGWWTG